MNLKKLISQLNLSGGIILILTVNAIGSLPRMYKGLQHPVGPEVVSVYASQGELG